MLLLYLVLLCVGCLAVVKLGLAMFWVYCCCSNWFIYVLDFCSCCIWLSFCAVCLAVVEFGFAMCCVSCLWFDYVLGV